MEDSSDFPDRFLDKIASNGKTVQFFNQKLQSFAMLRKKLSGSVMDSTKDPSKKETWFELRLLDNGHFHIVVPGHNRRLFVEKPAASAKHDTHLLVRSQPDTKTALHAAQAGEPVPPIEDSDTPASQAEFAFEQAGPCVYRIQHPASGAYLCFAAGKDKPHKPLPYVLEAAHPADDALALFTVVTPENPELLVENVTALLSPPPRTVQTAMKELYAAMLEKPEVTPGDISMFKNQLRILKALVPGAEGSVSEKRDVAVQVTHKVLDDNVDEEKAPSGKLNGSVDVAKLTARHKLHVAKLARRPTQSPDLRPQNNQLGGSGKFVLDSNNADSSECDSSKEIAQDQTESAPAVPVTNSSSKAD
eukprot:TRINITY_DN2982_c0_g1_i1.p1 TRINITY_DN2982_c0_g1~~TRINITY_DN2982_c0_g1_i1.p1  ORF type:complete len:380 (+),score=106.24 TRINITY_DN2982_c0_g1_i1:58-1140(+)